MSLRPGRAWLAAAALGLTATAIAAPAAVAETQRLRVVGGLAGVSQYTRHEAPFWTEELPRLTGGRYRADIVPFDRAGLRAGEMLRLMRLGVVPFGTALLSVSAASDPDLGAADLAGLHPDVATLRRSVAALRPHLQATLRERYGLELLAVYAYPAQATFCTSPVRGLASLAGRRIRTSSTTQSDWVEALGAIPVATAFADIVPNLRAGNIDCAITGTMSGHAIGLHTLTTHLHTMPVNWGLSVFAAHGPTWQALPADLRTTLREGLARIEQAVWAQAERESDDGVACNTGRDTCASGAVGRMTAVDASPADQALRRRIIDGVVVPRWLARCGAACAELWSSVLQPALGPPQPRALER